MASKRIVFASLVSLMCFVSCNNSNKTNSETPTQDTLTNSKGKDMKSYISMFEIPATDISRAINFYQALLDIKIEKMEVEGMQMGILPYEVYIPAMLTHHSCMLTHHNCEAVSIPLAGQ